MSNRKSAKRRAQDIEHAVVYRRENEFASHPYVRGFWETGSGHLIANFSVATVDYRGDPQRLAHIGLVNSPGGRRAVTMKSEDRGRSWRITNEDPRRPNNDVVVPRPGIDGRAGSLDELGPVDYSDRDVLVANFNHQYMNQDPQLREFYAAVKQEVEAPERQVFIRVSKDAGASWSRSVMLPLDGLYSLAGVESSLVRPDGQCLLFLNGVTRPGAAARPLVYRSLDAGTSFRFMSFIVPQDDPLYGGTNRMYPRGLLLPSGRMLATVRVDRDWDGDMWTEVYGSDDGGRTWQHLSRATQFGAPAAPLRLRDGRIVLVFGQRLAPHGLSAVVSEDEGRTWSPEIVIRDDGGSWDLGYPRAWEAAPGKVGVLYYFNSKDDPVQVKAAPGRDPWGEGGVRFIARSFFTID
jgi:hypothetical protein